MKKSLNLFILLSSLLSWQIFAQSGSLDEGFSQPTDMTDEEAKASKEFVHQGIKDRQFTEKCKEQGLGKCDGSDVDSKGFKAVLEQNIGRAYTMIFGGMGMLTGDGGPKFEVKPKTEAKTADAPKPPGGEAAPAGDAKPKENETKNDYCMYGAMAYETLAGFMQSSQQSKAEKESASIADPQLKALVNLKETHKARKKTATYQAAVYGTVAACYVVYGTTQGVVTGLSYAAKLGGATALATLYISKARKHDKAAKKVQVVIDSLPKGGDCNPWTGTQCFCDEKTSKELYPSQYQEVCVMNQGNFDTPRVAMGCGTMVNGKMEFDKECKCKQTNSCFNTQLKVYNPKFNLGKNFMNQANKGFDLLSSGEFDQAKLSSHSSKSATMAKAFQDKTKINAPKLKLNKEQKLIADSLKDVMPAPLAALAATAPESSPPAGGLMGGSSESALDKLPETVKKKVSDAQIKGNYKSKGSSSSAITNSEDEWQFPKMPGQEAAKPESVEVVSFAEKAFSKADVSNAPDTPIFDIISNRYRRSGWEKLQGEEKEKAK
jgi:hypothetical protein